MHAATFHGICSLIALALWVVVILDRQMESRPAAQRAFIWAAIFMSGTALVGWIGSAFDAAGVH
jgi:hypothetical protein